MAFHLDVLHEMTEEDIKNWEAFAYPDLMIDENDEKQIAAAKNHFQKYVPRSDYETKVIRLHANARSKVKIEFYGMRFMTTGKLWEKFMKYCAIGHFARLQGCILRCYYATRSSRKYRDIDTLKLWETQLCVMIPLFNFNTFTLKRMGAEFDPFVEDISERIGPLSHYISMEEKATHGEQYFFHFYMIKKAFDSARRAIIGNAYKKVLPFQLIHLITQYI